MHEYSQEPPDQETFHYLHDLGKEDAFFGPSGDLDVSTHAEQVREGWLAMAQAAHDRIIGQEGHTHTLHDDGNIDRVEGTAYAHDDLTNTSFKIDTIDTVDGTLALNIQSATAHDRRAQEAGFYKRHNLQLTYDSNGRVDDSGLTETPQETALNRTTASLDARDPHAFMRMAESINRSHASTSREFERDSGRVSTELATGRVGRFATLRAMLGGSKKGNTEAMLDDMLHNYQDHL